MMMSGKQYSLDSRIDLAEAVEEVNNKVHSYYNRLVQTNFTMHSPAKNRNPQFFSYHQDAKVDSIEEENGNTGVKGRSLSVVENSEVASQVGMVLRKSRGKLCNCLQSCKEIKLIFF